MVSRKITGFEFVKHTKQINTSTLYGQNAKF